MPVVWLAFSTYLLALALPFVLYRRAWGWFQPIVFTIVWWHLIQQILPRLGVYSQGLDYHRALPGWLISDLNLVVAKALLVDVVALLALYVGFFGSGRLPVPRLRFRPPRHLLVKVLLVGAVSLFALLRLIDEAGGLGPLMLQRGLSVDLRVRASLGGGHWQFMVGLLKTACLVWLALKPEHWRRPIFIAVFGAALFIGFAATGSRGGLYMPILMAGAIWALAHRRVPYLLIVVFGVAALAMIGILGEFRAESRGARSLDNVTLTTDLVDNLERGLADVTKYGTQSIGIYPIIAKVPEQVDFLYGQSYASIFLAPIPSVILPFDKPAAGGAWTAEHFFGTTQNTIPPSTIGEAYWNFHLPGVLIVMTLFGIFLKWLARLFTVNAGAPWVMVIYVYTLFALQPNSDSFYSWLHGIVPIVLFLLLFCGLPRRTLPSSASM